MGAAMQALKRHLPVRTVNAIRNVKRTIRRHTPWSAVKLAKQAVYWGNKQVCPVCESRVSRFLDTKIPADKCPVCGAIRRTRLAWLYLSRHTRLFDGLRRSVLHIAPERGIAGRLMVSPSIDYVAGDLDPGQFLVPKDILKVDLTATQFENDTFDAIICNHVLEHIPDDRAAMREILRALKPGGFAMLLVPSPHSLPTTIEDPEAPPEERARRFGQASHVRLYGADYADRLRSMGFGVNIWLARDAEPEMCRQWALNPDEEVYIGLKHSPSVGVTTPPT